MVRTEFKIPAVRCCKVCEQTKDINEFPTNRNKLKLTYRHRCIPCDKLYIKDVNRKNYDSRRKKPIPKEDDKPNIQVKTLD